MAKPKKTPEVVIEQDVQITEEPIKDPNVYGVVSNCSSLNVREKPDRNANVVGLLSSGDKVMILEGSNEEFYKTEIGYVMKSFITLQ